MSRFHDRMAALQREQESRRLELVRPLPGTNRDTVPELDRDTVPETGMEKNTCSREIPLQEANTVPNAGTLPGISTVPLPEREESTTLSESRIKLLGEGRKPVELGMYWVSLASRIRFEAKQVKWVILAQHSMTGGQERFYEALWKIKPDRLIDVVVITRQHKQIRAGYDLLAKATRCAVSTTRVLLGQLIEKRILHSYYDPVYAERRGTLYDVFGYEEILRRQRTAGLCYVVKRGPGVEFAIPEGWTLPEITRVTVSDSGTLPETGSLLNPKRESLPGMGSLSLPGTAMPLDNKETSFRQASSLGFLEQAKNWLPFLDQAGVEELWRQSHVLIPELTVEELINCLLRFLVLRMQRQDRVETIGDLLNTIPQWVRRNP